MGGDPTVDPTEFPTHFPSVDPTLSPTKNPSVNPTESPSNEPTVSPTLKPSANPSISPTFYPTLEPTIYVAMTNGLSANANKSLIASFAGMAGCFGCIAVAIFLHSKKKQARRELKDKSDDEITAGNNTKTKRLEMHSTTSTRTGGGNSTRTLTSKTVSVPSTTIYEPIVAVAHDKDSKFGEDDDELHHVTLDVDVPVVPQEKQRQRKKKRKKRKKKRRRMRRKDVTATGGMGTTKGMDMDECEEEECAVLTGPGCSYRENALQNEFNKLTFDMDQLLKYGVTPDGNGKMMTKGYVRTNKGNIVTKV